MENRQLFYPTILQALGLTIINFGLLYLCTIVLFSINGNQLPRTAIMLIGYLIAMSLSIVIGRNFRGHSIAALSEKWQQINGKAIFWIVLATIALDIGIVLPLSDFIPISDFFKQSIIENFGNLDVFMFIAIILAAPFFEEYIYRGILLDGLLKNYAPWLAIIVTSVLFGAIHVNPIQFVSATLGGLFLGWIYYKSSNLIYCMIIHLVINLTGFLILQQIGIERVVEKGFIELSGGIGNIIGIMLVSVVIIGSSIYQLNTLFKR